MIVVDINKLSTQDKKDLIRKLLASLPEYIQREEVDRAERILNHIPVYIVEAPDGTSVKASSISGISSAISSMTGKNPDTSNIYKVLRGELKTIFGVKIKRYFEGD